MAKRTISTEWLASWMPTKRTEIGDRDARGLRIRGGPSGVVMFRVYDRAPDPVTGELRRTVVNLGRWSETGGPGAMTLAEAQRAVLARRETKVEAPRRGDTVASLVEAYRRDRLAGQERGDEAHAVILVHVVKAKPDPKRPPFGEWPAATVTRADLAGIVRLAKERREVEGRRLGGPGAARVVLRHVVSIFAHAVDAGLLPGSVAAGMKLGTFGLKNGGRDRFLTAAELAPLFDALDLDELLNGTDKPARLKPATRLALAALVYTGTRTGAILNAKWDAVDLKAATWTVPPEDQKLTVEARKKAKPFVVPLCPTALAVFKRLRKEAGASPWVVTSPPRPGKEPARLEAKALAHALDRLQTATEESRNHPARAARLALTPKATVHDLRRTWRTWAGELGISVDLAEKALGHVAANQAAGFSAAADVYDRSERLDARREAMNLVGAAFDRIRQGDAAKVVPIKSGRAKRRSVGAVK
jgi:integrase